MIFLTGNSIQTPPTAHYVGSAAQQPPLSPMTSKINSLLQQWDLDAPVPTAARTLFNEGRPRTDLLVDFPRYTHSVSNGGEDQAPSYDTLHSSVFSSFAD